MISITFGSFILNLDRKLSSNLEKSIYLSFFIMLYNILSYIPIAGIVSDCTGM